MRSDFTLQSLIGLWISVWQLVQEKKRHLETVAAALQKIVFEAKGYPKFKNWSAICGLGRVNHFIMMAIATVDLSRIEKDEAIQQLIAAFPQCFSPEESHGPVPLSVIRYEAEMFASRKAYDSSNPGNFPHSYEAIPFWMPVQAFCTREAVSQAGLQGPMLPSTIDPDARQGTIVDWEGRNFVVLENNDSCEEMFIVPAECVVVDL